LWSQEFDTFLSDFQIFDVDGDGHLEKDEMILLFQAQLNREPSKKEVCFACLEACGTVLPFVWNRTCHLWNRHMPVLVADGCFHAPI